MPELDNANFTGQGAVGTVMRYAMEQAQAPDDLGSATPSIEPNADTETPAESESEQSEEEGQESSEESEEGEEASDEDADEEDSEEEEEDGESEEEDEGDEEEVTAKKPDYSPKKPVKVALADGKSMNIPPNATISVVVDGKEQNVNLHKVISEYSGKVFVDRELGKVRELEAQLEGRSSELDRQAEGFKALDALATKALDDIKSGKGLEAFHDIVMLTGKYKDPIDWEIEHLNAMFPVIRQLAEMTDEDQAIFLQKRRADFIVERDKRRQAAQAKAPEQVAAEKEVTAIRTDHGISDSEWSQASALLTKVEKAKKLGDYGITKVTPRVVADVVLQTRANSRADATLEKKFPNLKAKLGDEGFRALRSEVISVIRSFNPEEDDLVAVIRDAAKVAFDDDEDTADAKVLTRKLGGSKKVSKVVNAAKPSKQETKIRSFADARAYLNEHKR